MTCLLSSAILSRFSVKTFRNAKEAFESKENRANGTWERNQDAAGNGRRSGCA